ncbi:hypothetical protein BH10ACT11_BH10ACT11_17740 [soil metagenome]
MLDLASIGSLYERAIQDTGREPEFLFLVSFLGMFAVIRSSAHMIRAQVSWWPGNVEVGGTHIHHLVWGILLLLIFGYVGAVIRPEAPFHQISIIAFGLGTGLTLDEFALWLNLRDVYWEKEGRRSSDAVIIAGLVSATLVVSFSAWVDVADDVKDGVFAVVGAIGAIGIVLAVLNASKEKFWVAGFSLFLPPVGIVGLCRLAKPRSMWAHRIYGEKKLAKSIARYGEPRSEPSDLTQGAADQSAGTQSS